MSERPSNPPSSPGLILFSSGAKAVNYCPSMKKGTTSLAMHNIQKTFEEKLKAGTMLLQEGRASNTYELSFFRHQDRGKGHVMMASRSEVGVEMVTPVGELHLDMMVSLRMPA